MPEEVGRPIMLGNTPAEFVAPHYNKRRLVRAPKNPLDKCTIVSIYPRPIDEVKISIEPGRFHIDPGTLEKPSLTVVGSSSWWKDYDWDQPMLEIPHSSIQVAQSVVNDYCNGMFGCNMADSMPGLFFVLGEYDNPMEIKLKYKKKLDEMNIKQNTWYGILVRAADSLWARSNGNPLVIMEDMRLAARSLNLNDKPWLKDYQVAELIRCVFCGGMRNPLYPICPNCKAIDSSHPLAGTVKFAV